MEDQEGTGEVSETGAVVGADPGSETTPVVGAGDPWDEAFSQAEAAIAAAPEAGSVPVEDADEASGAAHTDPPKAAEGEAAKPPGSPATKTYSVQGALDHAMSLISQGRESELSPEERGAVQRFRTQQTATLRQQIKAEQDEERGFAETFAEMHADRLEDPELFAASLVEDPGRAEFYRMYASDHPEALTEDGIAPAVERTQVTTMIANATKEANASFRNGLEAALSALASNYGVNYQEHRGRAGNQLGTLLQNVFTASVEAAAKAEVTKQLPALTKNEREAAEQAATAKYANRTVLSPRHLQGPGGPQGTQQGKVSMERAFELAEEQTARRSA